MAQSPAFSEETQKGPIVVGLNTAMIDNGGTEDWFWELKDNHFVSLQSVQEKAETVTIVVTREQLKKLLGKAYV